MHREGELLQIHCQVHLVGNRNRNAKRRTLFQQDGIPVCCIGKGIGQRGIFLRSDRSHYRRFAGRDRIGMRGGNLHGSGIAYTVYFQCQRFGSHPYRQPETGQFVFYVTGLPRKASQPPVGKAVRQGAGFIYLHQYTVELHIGGISPFQHHTDIAADDILSDIDIPLDTEGTRNTSRPTVGIADTEAGARSGSVECAVGSRQGMAVQVKLRQYVCLDRMAVRGDATEINVTL